MVAFGSTNSSLYNRLVSYSFLGIGLYWTWIYIVCFSTMIFPQSNDAAAAAQTSEYISMLFYVIALLISAVIIKPLTHGICVAIETSRLLGAGDSQHLLELPDVGV
jgi:hypothetical protein